MSNYDAEKEIKSWLDFTGLSEDSKQTLLSESLLIYGQLGETVPGTRKELAKDAVFLACDKYSCAITRILPQPNMSSLVAARRKTHMDQSEPLEKVDAMVRFLKLDNCFAEEAKGVLLKYKEKYPQDYYKGSPSVTTAAAIKLAGDLLNKPITASEFGTNLGISDTPIYKKRQDMVDKLDLGTRICVSE
ncbi:MAG: hypothetical protein ABIF85_01005 [Nanoarchaeota archaeon]|nr:hypothetical protein [Nanoarchaeota archaeon]MBU4299709.1 hypothetical protein [Nanoarchaeota archaeon]MBU4451450.1 hypothetical protein [Nanoarchaeota archaeon]MCG2723782.1 hypothetical protein [archaeon]